MSRRNLLGGFAVLIAAPSVALTGPSMSSPALRRVTVDWSAPIPPCSDTELTAEEIAAAAAPNPDAELIRTCEAHPTILAALDEHGSGKDDCPLWLAYVRSRNAIHAAVPTTLAGIIAKARAAKVEAVNPEGGTESPSGTPGETWAWDLVNDLLRLEGCA